jgi:ERCC4 domain/Lsr2
VPEDFVIARNPDGDSSLPYILRIPLAPRPVILKARDTWPRTSKVYCHRVDDWPDEPEIVERVKVRSCTRRGAAIELVLDRWRENRSQIVIANARGRQMIFWQTARTAKQARPAVTVPSAPAGRMPDLEVTVDSHERYPFTFRGSPVSVRRAALPSGDYGLVVDGDLVAVVERKSLQDLVSSLTSGKLRFQLSHLAAVPRAAVVVEERYSSVFKHKHVRASVLADAVAECQVRWPSVPIVFCDNRKLAQEWTYRFLAAAARGTAEEAVGAAAIGDLASGGDVPPVPPTTAELRAWALANGHPVSERGRVSAAVRAAYQEAHGGS